MNNTIIFDHNENPITIHTNEDFQKMRKAGNLASQVLDFITPYVKESVTTNELDQLCHDFILSKGAIPAPLNYKGFPSFQPFPAGFQAHLEPLVDDLNCKT